MLAFVGLVTLVLGATWSFTWWRLVAVAELPASWQIFFAALFGLSFLLQPARWIFKDFFHDRFRWQLGIYLALGLMAHLFFGAIFKELVLAAWWVWAGASPSLEAQRWACGIAVALAVAANFYGFFTAKRGPLVRRVEVTLPHWPEGAEPFHLAQISDLHVSSLIRRPYVEAVVAQVNALGAHAIAITGDLGDGQVAELAHHLAPLADLRAPHGVLYVPGNHEYYWNVHEWLAAVTDLGFVPLMNEGRLLPLSQGQLWIGGVPDVSAAQIGGHESVPAQAMPPKEAHLLPKILLAHQPKSVFEAVKAGFDLLVVGHTHNGQFFPFNFLVGYFNPYSRGLHRHGSMQVYVNSGTGYWGPPQRLGVRSEITLLILKG